MKQKGFSSNAIEEPHLVPERTTFKRECEELDTKVLNQLMGSSHKKWFRPLKGGSSVALLQS